MPRGLLNRSSAVEVIVVWLALAGSLSANPGVDLSVWRADAGPLPFNEAAQAWAARMSGLRDYLSSDCLNLMDSLPASLGQADWNGLDPLRVDEPADDAGSVSVLRVASRANGDGTAWPDALETLEEALALGQSLNGPVQIWVAQGTYVPGDTSGNQSSAFVLFNGAELLGGFAGHETDASQRNPDLYQTILSGDRGLPVVKDDNSFHIVKLEGFNTAATIDGFIIRDGNANGTGDDRSGAGVFVKYASLTVRNCLMIDNAATKNGGAIHATGSTGTVVIENCVFANNQAETGGGVNLAHGGTVINSSFLNNSAVFGGGLNANAALQVSRCAFDSNYALEGGGISVQGGSLSMKWTSLRNNSGNFGAGIRIISGTNHRIANSSIVLGTASEGGGIHTTGPCTLTNTLIAFNNAFAIGGAMYSNLPAGQAMTFTNCTIWKNNASQSAGGVFLGGGSAAINNSVFFENAAFGAASPFAAQCSISIFATATARYSCIQGVAGSGVPALGPGNFDDHPMFIAPLGSDGLPGTADDNFAPGPGSPLLDRAEDASFVVDALDVDEDEDLAELVPLDLVGNPRFAASPLVPVPYAHALLRGDIGAVEAPGNNDQCPSDIDGNGIVDANDLTILLNQFGQAGVERSADLNQDGVVDSNDLTIMLNSFGDTC